MDRKVMNKSHDSLKVAEKLAAHLEAACTKHKTEKSLSIVERGQSWGSMKKSQGGEFSKSLLSLQLQMQTLLENAGGDQAANLLDELSEFHPSERAKLLPALGRVLRKLAQSQARFPTDGDLALKSFEDQLFGELFSALTSEKPSRLAVLDGGKKVNTRKAVALKKCSAERAGSVAAQKAPIDIAQARRQRMRVLYN
jgi:hypothetical protein